MLAERQEFDVVIVGLGPVGAVAANIAGLLGLKTLVLERTDHAYLKPRAIVFDAEVMRIFASIGLAERIAKASRSLGGSIYLGADRHPIRTFRARQPAHAKAWYPSNLFYQPELESILRDGLNRFSNVTVSLKAPRNLYRSAPALFWRAMVPAARRANFCRYRLMTSASKSAGW
jgi:3-(3-hydroxy-phenyl)propionate hydroxylase